MGYGCLIMLPFRCELREFKEKIDDENICRRLPFYNRACLYNIMNLKNEKLLTLA